MTSRYEVNSKDYWEERFSGGSWEECGGEEQSAFFGKVLCQTIPSWLKKEMNENSYTVIDWGCAEGGGTAYMARQFPSCTFVGMDFSGQAIQKAREKHPQCQFKVGDVYVCDNPADIIISSNTLEHLTRPLAVLRNLVQCAKRHVVLAVPFYDDTEIEEHINRFTEGIFPIVIERHRLSYFQIVDCRNIVNTMWPGFQLVIVYSKEDILTPDRTLADLFSCEFLRDMERVPSVDLKCEEWISLLREELQRVAAENRTFCESVLATQEKMQELQKEREMEYRTLCESLSVARQKIEELQQEWEVERKKSYETLLLARQEAQTLKQELESQKEKVTHTDSEVHRLQGELAASDKRIARALAQLNKMVTSKLFKLVHLCNRFLHQGFHKDEVERKLFRKWLIGRFSNAPDMDHRYNPLFSVIGILEESNTHEVITSDKTRGKKSIANAKLRTTLQEAYRRPDIIELAIIDFDFRHQRPQHLAQRLARKGHRVFYIDANFRTQSEHRELEQNLYQLKLSSTLYAAIYGTDFRDCEDQMRSELDAIVAEFGIRDAIVLVDYPNWVNAAVYLKSKYGFRVVTDYMDDYTGFLNPAEKLVRENCFRLLESSNAVIASSAFLEEIAHKYSNNVYVSRNGTEYAYFHQAYQENNWEKDRPIIGYYGAIAEWFNADVVCYCAKRFPQCDIVLVGAVTAHRKELEAQPNIRLIGEVPYKELLPWLESFDVCLIPFDTSTDLIKATNPVKFYEYLSAGKKVVATEIPELMPYCGKFALLENNSERFGDAVERCLKGTDGLASAEEMFTFAQNNDWDARAADVDVVIDKIYPKVSIIVLCYNQLEYTKKCVESILNNTAYPNYELIIVDNNSSDGTTAYLEKMAVEYERIRIVLNTTNRGFAGGNNDGIAVSRGEYIVLLNNDTIVTRGWLTGLVKHYDGSSKVALVGPVTNSIGNEGRIVVDYDSVEDMPTFAFCYTQEHMGEEYPHQGVLAMYCLMISRAFYEKAGPLDENYGVGMFEDDDYTMVARKLGYKVIMAEDVFIHHYGTVSFKKLENAKYRKIFDANKAYYEKKWGVKWEMHHSRPNVCQGE